MSHSKEIVARLLIVLVLSILVTTIVMGQLYVDLFTESYDVSSLVRLPIVIGEPVQWVMTIASRNSTESVNYSTSPIYEGNLLTNLTKGWIKFVTLQTDYEAGYENVSINQNVPNTNNIFLTPSLNYSIINKTSLQISIPLVKESYSFQIEGKKKIDVKGAAVNLSVGNIGTFGLKSQKGIITQASLSDKLELTFELEDLPLGEGNIVEIDLPYKVPKHVDFYVYGKNTTGSYSIPYQISTNRKKISIDLEYFLTNQNNSLLLYKPSIEADIFGINTSLITAQLAKKGEVHPLRLQTSQGFFSKFSFVESENTPNKPPQEFIFDLFSFELANITENATIQITYPIKITDGTYFKFNPQEISWFEYPYTIIDEYTIELFLIDGGIGDADGLKNGRIVDPGGIGSWINDSWDYKQNLTIYNAVDLNVTNFTVKINIDNTTAGNVFNWSDADLKFTQYNFTAEQELEIPYYIESWNTAAQNATIWVELEQLFASSYDWGIGAGNHSILMYYGNSGTTANTSNGEETFLIYENMTVAPAGTLNGDATYDATNDWVQLTPASNNQNGILSYSRNPDYGVVATFEQFIGGGNDGESFWFGVHDTTVTGLEEDVVASGYHFTIDQGQDQFAYTKSTTTDGSAIATSGDATLDDGVWHNIEIRYFNNDDDANGLIFYDDVLQINATDGTTQSRAGDIISFGGRTTTKKDIQRVRNIIVRKYIGIEPSVSFLGTAKSGLYNVSIDEPQQSDIIPRSGTFTMNGTIECIRGNCDNTSVLYQYFSVSTPQTDYTETTTSDFNSFNSTTNVTIFNDALQLSVFGGGAAWWNDAWTYRRPFNISENTGLNLTDYQVNVTIDTSTLIANGKLNSDCSDMRFVNGSGYEFSYWLEDGCNTVQTHFWVKVPVVEASSIVEMYYYYGNSIATSTSNPGDTLFIYDNMSSTPSGTLSGSGTYITGATNYVQLTTASNDDLGFLSYTMNPGEGLQADFDIYAGGGNDGTAIWFAVHDTTTSGTQEDVVNGGYHFAFDERQNRIAYTKSTSTDGTALATSAEANINDAAWHDVRVSYFNDGSNAQAQIYFDGAQRINFTDTSPQSISGDVVAFGARTTNRKEEHRVTNVTVRKYVYPYPSITAANEQEVTYETNGEYISDVLDIGTSEVEYLNVSWLNVTNVNTSLQVFTRSSSSGNPGTFSAWFSESKNSQIQSANQQYLQYRVILSSTYNKTTPLLEEITLSYRAATNDWATMQSSDTIFTTNTPFECGILNSTSGNCSPTLSVFATQAGNFAVRLLANSSDSLISNVVSDVRNITVYIYPSFSTFTTSSSLVPRGDSTTLTATLVDEKSDFLSGINLSFWDETGNGVRQFIDWAITDSVGTASVTYTPDTDYTLGVHTLNVSSPSNNASFIEFANTTLDLTITSRPIISNITTIPVSGKLGTGYNITITANVSDETGLEDVFINVTNQSGFRITSPMTSIGGDLYTYNFNDTWRVQDYTYIIYANNSDGTFGESSLLVFEIEFFANASISTVKDDYQFNEIVYLNGSLGINNTGVTNFSGYLRSLVQRWTGSGWQNLIPPVINHEFYEVNLSQPLNISLVWANNGGYDTSTNPPGIYRVYSVFEDPSFNILRASDGSQMLSTYNFTILESILRLSNLTYDNLFTYGLYEYETGEIISWINVTTTPLNNTALDANVTLELLDDFSNPLSWGPQNETKFCGNISVGGFCERQWDNNSNGYLIPQNATLGSYTFFWDVWMDTASGPLQRNNSLSFIVHDLPSNTTGGLSDTRIFKPASSNYTVNVTNPWSAGLTNVNVTINCPPIAGFTCAAYSSGTLVESIGSIPSLVTGQASFNISVNDSVPIQNYLLNVTLNYTNPTSYRQSKSEVGVITLEVRKFGILEITDFSHPAEVTRGDSITLSANINNTDITQVNDSWFNFTLPSAWVNTSGNLTEFFAQLQPGDIVWNNITAFVGSTSELGDLTVRLDSGTDDANIDFITYDITTYAHSSVASLANNSIVNQGESVILIGTLTYDNGSVIPGQSITFTDVTQARNLGSAITNSSGQATLSYAINGSSILGIHTINMSYAGSGTRYTRQNSSSTTIDIRKIPDITFTQSSPSRAGYGQYIYINASVVDADGLDSVSIQITAPNSTVYSADMVANAPEYYYNFTNTWSIGEYSVLITANDTTSAYNYSSTSFNISSDLVLKLDTFNESYEKFQNVTLKFPQDIWWNESFKYYKNISLTNNDALTYTDVAAKIILNTSNISSYIQSKCQDIRFAYYNSSSDTHTLLSYWNETACNLSSNTTYWVKLPSIGASSSITIQAYYGNEFVSTQVNEVNTFLYFDTVDSFTGWTQRGSGSVAQSSVRKYRGTDSAYKSGSNDANGATKSLGNSYNRGVILEFWFNRNSAYSGDGSDMIGITDSLGNGYGMDFDHDANQLSVDTRTTYTASSSGAQALTDQTNTWLFGQVIIDNNSNNITTNVFKEGSLYAKSSISSGTYTNFSRIYILGGYDYWVDDIRLRQNANITFSESSSISVGSGVFNLDTVSHFGYVRMIVQSLIGSSWQNITTVVDDVPATRRSIDSNYLDLSSIWVPWNTQNLDGGEYRILATLHGPDDTQLINNDGSNISGTSQFTILDADTLLNISLISVYEVTDTVIANRHFYTNDFISEGINTTFSLTENELYRIEITVQNYGTSPWDINSSNISASGFLSGFIIDDDNDIWYSNETLFSNRRSDSSREGGNYSTKLLWNETVHDGVGQNQSNVTFFFIVNTSNTGTYQQIMNISALEYEYLDYSTFIVNPSVTPDPKLFNNIYNVTPINVTRGNNVTVYARWNNSVLSANATVSTTSPAIFTTKTSGGPFGSNNWTNFTFTSLSTWYRGSHTAKIQMTDTASKNNRTLTNTNFIIWGQAQISTSNLLPSSIDVTNTTQMRCRVVDSTFFNNPIANYVVEFSNSTNVLGTNQTNSTGWGVYSFADTTIGNEAITCQIYENRTSYYTINGTNTSSSVLSTGERVEPNYSLVQGPSIANKGDTIDLISYWTDNYELESSVLQTNASGTLINISTLTLSSTASWANFSYTIPTSMTPGTLSWRQIANDTFGNINQTPLQSIDVWGYSQISTSSLVPSSIQQTNTTMISCTVIDANSSVLLSGYSVSFYYKNDTDPTYNFLGNNNTVGGIANFSFSEDDVGLYDVKCNITDNTSLKYNESTPFEQIESLNVVSGSDLVPPKIISGYAVNTTLILRNSCVAIDGYWDESINYSYIQYNETPGIFHTIDVSTPYTNNWTNGTLCSNSSWIPGEYSLRLIARDQAGNLNNTLDRFTITMRGRADVNITSLGGNYSRGNVYHECLVTDRDTGLPISNYPINIYDSDLGFSIGSGTTNATGKFSTTYDHTNFNVGPDQVSCTISNQLGMYYITARNNQINNIDFIENLTSTIQNPTANEVVHRGDSVFVNISVRDNDSDIPLNQNGVRANLTVDWRNTTHVIAINQTSYWQVGSHPLGPQTITAYVSHPYYNETNDTQTIEVWGYSQISLTSPVASQFGDNTNLEFRCQVTDNVTSQPISGYAVTFIRNGTNEGTVLTNSSGYAGYSVNTNTLTDGSQFTYCFMGDNGTQYYNASAQNNGTKSFSIDKANPTISYNPSTDSNGSSYSRNWIFVNVTASDNLALDTILLNWSGTLESFGTNVGSHWWSNKTGLIDGTYTFNGFANDTFSNENVTSTYSITLDTTAPVIQIIDPTNNTWYTSTSQLVTVIADGPVYSCWYDVGGTNTTLTSFNSSYYNDSIVLSEGSNILRAYCNDSANNIGTTQINANIDATAPSISLLVPANNTVTQNKTINFTALVSDNINISSVSFYTNASGWTNISYNTSGVNNTNYVVPQTLLNGRYLWSVRVCDNANCYFADNFTFTIFTSFDLTVFTVNESAQIYTNANITLSNGSGIIVSETDGLISNQFLNNTRYNISSDVPVGTNSVEFFVEDILISQEENISIVVSYPYSSIPTQVINQTPLVSINTSQSFTQSNIVIPTFNITPNYVYYCDVWNFTTALCDGGWTVNSTSDFTYGFNGTDVSLNITSFGAYMPIFYDNISPVINSVNSTPNQTTFGNNITIYANITENAYYDRVWVQINNTNYTMNAVGNTIFAFEFNTSSFVVGDYNFTVYANDTANNNATQVQSNFSILSSNQIDLYVANITFNPNAPIEENQTIISVNVSNNLSTTATGIVMQLNISLYNGTYVLNESQTSTTFSVSANNWTIVQFNWTAGIGTYTFDAYVDHVANITESDDTNNQLLQNLSVSSLGTFYGNFSYDVKLGETTDTLRQWVPTSKEGNIYYYDVDSSFIPFDLEGLNGAADFVQADTALRSTYFNDSLRYLFDTDNNGVADSVANITISGLTKINVPYYQTSASFRTFILYDLSDGVGYDGSQDLVIVTQLNETSAGLYGIYDYEVQVPVRMKGLVGATNRLERLDELI